MLDCVPTLGIWLYYTGRSHLVGSERVKVAAVEANSITIELSDGRCVLEPSGSRYLFLEGKDAAKDAHRTLASLRDGCVAIIAKRCRTAVAYGRLLASESSKLA